MVIKELRLKNFGKFHDRIISLKDGINVIYGENEAGKSTIHSFMQGMLFGIDKPRGKTTKEDPYVKYEPWDTPGLYNGSMDLFIEGKVYRLQRNFNRFQKSFTLTDLNTGREVSNELYESLLEGLTESGYKNTISIGQLKAKTEKELAEELRNYITNLSLTKTTVDVGRAMASLKAKKKSIEARKLTEEIRELENRIKENYRIEDKIDELSVSKNELVKRLEEIKEKLIKHKANRNTVTNASYDKLEIILDRYKVYQEEGNKRKEFEQKLQLIEKELEELELEYVNPKPLGQGIEELNGINKELTKVQEELVLSSMRLKEAEEASKKRQGFMLLPFAILVISIILMTQKLIVFGVSLLAISIIAGAMSGLNYKKGKHIIDSALKYNEDIRKEENYLQSKRNEIFRRFHVANELDLHKKYDRTKLWDTTYELKEKVRRSLVDELKLIEEHMREFKQGFLNYVEMIGFKEQVTQVNDAILYKVQDYVKLLQEEKVKAIQVLEEEYELCQQEISRITWDLESYRNNEEELLYHEEKIKDLYKELSEQELTLKAIDLAINSIERIAMDIHDGFGYELNNLVSNLISSITNGKYTKVIVDEKLGIKVCHKDELYDVTKLSVGTMEQLYLSLRLAVADIMFKELSLPILLDDSFAYYDDNRTKQALHTIYNNKRGQVLLFTCHKREKELLEEQEIPYHYVSL